MSVSWRVSENPYLEKKHIWKTNNHLFLIVLFIILFIVSHAQSMFSREYACVR